MVPVTPGTWQNLEFGICSNVVILAIVVTVNNGDAAMVCVGGSGVYMGSSRSSRRGL